MKSYLAIAMSLSIILIACSSRLCAQNVRTIPPTPNAAKILEITSPQPNLYTGTANFTLPLYTIDFDGWKLPLSISYSASGVRTNEEASEIGLGWALSATGSITRVVRGSDDLQQASMEGRGLGWVYDKRIAPDSIMGWDRYSQTEPSDTSYYTYLVRSEPDTQPDIFSYSFFGYSGTFILSKLIDGDIHPIKLTQDQCKITFNEPTKVFEITTPSGYKGIFSVFEISTTFTSNAATTDRSIACEERWIDIKQMENDRRLRAISSWYLKSIASPTQQIAQFYYYLDSDGSSSYISNQRAFAEEGDAPSNCRCIQTVQEHVYLRAIATKQDSVYFTMRGRSDLRRNDMFITVTNKKIFRTSFGTQRYSGVNVYSRDTSSTFAKTILFKQNYFNQGYEGSGSENEVLYLRNRLYAVIIDDQEYRFKYYKGDAGLPSKTTLAVDHFGFYNGRDNNSHLLNPFPTTSIPPCDLRLTDVYYYRQQTDRLVDFNFGKAGLLERVVYPTKGYTTFEYEAHTYNPAETGWYRELAGTKTAGGARIASIKDFNENSVLIRQKDYRYSAGGVPSPFNTTGKLMTPLMLLGKKPTFQFQSPGSQVWQCAHLISSNSSIPGNNTAEGKLIGYSEVHEWVVATNGEKYRNVYYFENTPNKTPKLPMVMEGYGDLNGKIKQEVYRNASNQIVSVSKNADYDHRISTVPAIAYTPGNPVFLGFVQRYELPQSFNVPYRTIKYTPASPLGIVTDTSSPDSLKINDALKVETSYLFDQKYSLQKQTVFNSDGTFNSVEYSRAFDFSRTNAVIGAMQDNNMLDLVIQEKHSKNDVLLSATGNRYQIDNGRINLASTYLYTKGMGAFPTTDGVTFAAPFQLQDEYLDYDDASGKLLEYRGHDGITNSFVWGHNNTLPIVHGIGIGNSALKQAHDIALGTSDYDGQLRASTGSAQITTFVHNPLVGLTKITNPAGQKKTFEYDQYSKLKIVRDHKGEIIEKYDYHYKYIPPTRILNATASVDFGTFYLCNKPNSVKITLANDGADDLTVRPSGHYGAFSLSWAGGTIPAGESIDAFVTFNDWVSPGTYKLYIEWISDKTSGSDVTELNANLKGTGTDYSLSLSSQLVVTTVHMTSYLTMKNVGNDCVRIFGLNYASAPNNPDWSLDMNVTFPYDLAPGDSLPIAIYQKSADWNGIDTIDPLAVTINTFQNGVGRTFTVTKRIQKLSFSKLSIAYPPFITQSKYDEVTVTNTGNVPMDITAASSSSYFMLSTTGFHLEPGQSIPLGLTFSPPQYDFSTRTATVTLTWANPLSQTNTQQTITATGQRTPSQTMSLTPSSLTLGNSTAAPSPVEIRNTGNTDIYVSGTTIPEPGWSATVRGTLPVKVVPDQTIWMDVRLNVNGSNNTTVTVNADGVTSGNTMTLTSIKRVQGLTPTSLSFPSFTSSYVDKTITVSNSGTGNLTLGSITVSPTDASFKIVETFPITIAPGNQKTLTVRFQPPAYDFTAHSKTITLNSDMTSGTASFTVSAQRTPVRQMQLSATSLAFTYTGQSQSVTVTNNGTDYLDISGITNPETRYWSTTLSPVPPTRLAIGGTATLTITRLPAQDPGTWDITVNANITTGGNSVRVSAPTKNMNLPTGPVSFGTFTNSTVTKDININNNGNTTLTISSVTSTNSKFKVVPNIPAGGITIAPGATVAVTIQYTSSDFTSQSSTLTFNSDATYINNSTGQLTVTAQQSTLQKWTVTPGSVSVTYSQQNPTVTVRNEGNVNVTIYSTTNTNAGAFKIVTQGYSGGILINKALPITLVPNETMVIVVSSADGSFVSATGILTVKDNTTGGNPKDIYMSRGN